MRLTAACSLLIDIFYVVRSALPATLYAACRSPSILLRPKDLSRIFMANVWVSFADSVDQCGRAVKHALIHEHAQGIVLDLGAGHGHTIPYLDPSRVTKYIALEPNTLMHPHIRAAAHKAGYAESDGSFQLLSCGAENAHAILLATSNVQVDTIVSVLTLCSVPDPQKTISSLVQHVLCPGGQLLFCEHVLSDRKDVAWWQRFWAPVWSAAFDGCRLDRPTHRWIEGLRDRFWREGKSSRPDGDSEEDLFTRQQGRYVKAY